MRIGIRLLLGYLLIVMIAGYFILTIFIKEVTPGVRRATEATLIDTANLLAHIVTQDLTDLSQLNGSNFTNAFEQASLYPLGANIDGIIKNKMAYRVYITDRNGIVIFDSTGVDIGKDYSRWNDVYITLRGRYGARSTLSNPDDPASTVMYVAAPLRINGDIVGVLTVAKPNKSMEVVVARGERRILYSGGLLIGLALLIGLLFIWWINRSINKLVKYAEQVSHHEAVLLPKFDSPELTTLAHALENMRIKLEGKDYVEQYVHTLTHELKSPLAAIQGATEILQDDLVSDVQQRFLNNIDQQSQRMQLLIDRMLQQARLESRVGVEFHPIKIQQILQQVVEGKRAQAEVLQIDLILDDCKDATLLADKFLLTQALSNLIDNALDFTPIKGRVEVTGAIYEGAYQITVSDTGAGIPDFAIDKVFARFYSLPRPDKVKSTGLGLSFVKEVALLHNGSIQLINRQEGGTSAIFSIRVG